MSKARLNELIDEALVDANGESEQVTGFYTIKHRRRPDRAIASVSARERAIDVTAQA